VVKGRAIDIEQRGWQERYPYYSTYLDIEAANAEITVAEADIARAFGERALPEAEP